MTSTAISQTSRRHPWLDLQGAECHRVLDNCAGGKVTLYSLLVWRTPWRLVYHELTAGNITQTTYLGAYALSGKSEQDDARLKIYG